MTAAAMGLIFVSTLLHAGWNLLLKRTRVPDQTAFTLLFLWMATVLFFPVAAWAIWRYGMPAAAWRWAGLSVALESLYWLFLTRAYEAGDMSAIYPVARGTGAMLAAALGLLLLHEPLTAGVAAGIGLIMAGGYVLNWPMWNRRQPAARGGVYLALLTGLTIGLYSVVDKQAVANGAPVWFYVWVPYAGPAVVLTLAKGRRLWRMMPETWRAARGAALLVGICSPLTYVLVLGAMLVAPISRVASAREISLVWGALMGRWVLRERVGATRLLGAGAIAAGVITLALTR